jgi:hypothetical protein
MSTPVSVEHGDGNERHTFWLQIPIDETHQMQILERSRDFSCVEPRCIFVHTLVWPGLKSCPALASVPQAVWRAPTPEELSTAAVFHAQVEVVFRLERVIQSNNKWVVARRQDLLLGQGTLDLVPLDHLLLAQNLNWLATRPLSCHMIYTFHGV